MRALLILGLLMAPGGAGRAQPASTQVVKFDRLAELMHPPIDRIQIINFWATWCAPCVKELPYFEALHSQADPVLRITLVSVDFKDKLDKVNAFVSRKRMKAPVILLDEMDYNSWIDRVDKSWSGAIPATLVINGKTGARRFVERELAAGELEELVNSVR